MRQSRERSHLVGLQPDLLDGLDQTLSTSLPEHNTHHLPQGNTPFSHSYAEVDPLGTLARQNFGVIGDSEVEGELGESLAGLELNGNEGFSNSEPSDGTIGRTNNIGMDANRLQYVPETVNPWLLSDFANNPVSLANTIPTSSQPSYGADSPSAWPPLSHRFGQSFANLHPQIYAPRGSSAATRSENSDSAWETLPPSPFADDNDSWLMPDENSASMQSYNDPRTGIWVPEDAAYERGTAYSSIRDMGHDNAVNFTMPQLLQPHLQEVIANADAATPFRGQPDPNGGAILVNAGIGANESPQIAAPLLLTPSTTGGPVPPSFQSSVNGHSGISIVVDSTMNLGASSARQSQAVERFFYPIGSDQSAYSNMAPRIASTNPAPLPATDLPFTMLMGTLAPAPSPSPSADTSTAEFARCPHAGCQAKFIGKYWKDSLRRHNTRIHGDKTKPTCPVCHFIFESGRPDNVKRHIKDIHPGHPLPASRNARPRKLAQRRRRS